MGKMTKQNPHDDELTREQIEDLIFGADLLSGLPACFPNKAARHTAFLEHADDLVTLFAKRRPGQRPALWWELVAPEERRIIGEAGRIMPDRAMKPYVLKESDAQYLDRLNFALPFERSIIREKIKEDEAQQRKLMAAWADLVQQFGERGKVSVLK